MSTTAWEQERDWATIRPFVYYQLENFVDRGLVAGCDVVDFSAGLGDLSEYVGTLGPKSLVATAHHPAAPRPDRLPSDARWVPGVGAQNLAEQLDPDSADIVLARMVIQFPTMEHDQVDVDDILSQVSSVLRPGGRVVMSTHAHFDLPWADTYHGDIDVLLESTEADAHRLEQLDDPVGRKLAAEMLGRVALVRYLDLPPREGPFGSTGFGLKIPMLIASFLRAGFELESVEDIEPFTFPYALANMARSDVVDLGSKFMDRKRAAICSDDYEDIYRRPQVLRELIDDLRSMTPVTAVPIVRVQAIRP